MVGIVKENNTIAKWSEETIKHLWCCCGICFEGCSTDDEALDKLKVWHAAYICINDFFLVSLSFILLQYVYHNNLQQNLMPFHVLLITYLIRWKSFFTSTFLFETPVKNSKKTYFLLAKKYNHTKELDQYSAILISCLVINP